MHHVLMMLCIILLILTDVAVLSETLAWKINQPKPVFTAEKDEEGNDNEQ